MKQLNQYTLEELKSLAYDLIRQREQNMDKLQAVNRSIAQKENKEKEDEPKPNPTNNK